MSDREGGGESVAQPMMHLLIADKIYTEKSGSIPSYGDFLLGSIAPDAVHMSTDDTRERKCISHYGFTRESHLSYFDTFFGAFATAENRDFVLGYLVHLLSDMIWYHSVRVPFKERFVQAPFIDRSMNEAYYADCGQIDKLLFWEENAPHIINGIRGGKAYSLEGMIDSESVGAWKEKLILDYHTRRNVHLHTGYILEHHVRDYIADCAKECGRYLDLHQMFQHGN